MEKFDTYDVYVNKKTDARILILGQRTDRPLSYMKKRLFLSNTDHTAYIELEKDCRSACGRSERGFLKDYSCDLDNPTVCGYRHEGDTITVSDIGEFVKESDVTIELDRIRLRELPSNAYGVSFCLQDDSDSSMYVCLYPKFRTETGANDKLIRVDLSGSASEYSILEMEIFRDGGTTDIVFEHPDDRGKVHFLHYDTPFNNAADRLDYLDEPSYYLDLVKVDDELINNLRDSVQSLGIRIIANPKN